VDQPTSSKNPASERLEGSQGMRRSNNNLRDVGEMTNRLVIDLFKRKIYETELDPLRLKGSWNEACEILQSHFGKVSRVMVQNEYKLHSLYRTAIKELQKV
jgi:hypothetical protein